MTESTTNLVLSNTPYYHRRSSAPPDSSRRNELHFARTPLVAAQSRIRFAECLCRQSSGIVQGVRDPTSLQLKYRGCRFRSASEYVRQGCPAHHGATEVIECSITVQVATGSYPKYGCVRAAMVLITCKSGGSAIRPNVALLDTSLKTNRAQTTARQQKDTMIEQDVFCFLMAMDEQASNSAANVRRCKCSIIFKLFCNRSLRSNTSAGRWHNTPSV